MGYIPGSPEPKISERWYKKLYRTEKVTVNGQEFELQMVPPRWHVELCERCGMVPGSTNRQFHRYMDTILKNVVISPAEVTRKGYEYFNERYDMETPELLMNEIDRFFRPGEYKGEHPSPTPSGE